MLGSISTNVRGLGRLVKAALGFYYDFSRYLKHGPWRADMRIYEVRSFHLVKIYHSLEKSLAFKARNPGSGWSQAGQLADILVPLEAKNGLGFHEARALAVLAKFCKHPDNVDDPRSELLLQRLAHLTHDSSLEVGALHVTGAELTRGRLVNPEEFFLSRHSLREFAPDEVPLSVVMRALELAQKTPSACNRQTWHVYHTADPAVKLAALKHQSGNRGFGRAIPNLLVITTDIKGFIPSNEHYQHWIDGGMYSMSLIYALHSLGVSSCCLNWSQEPRLDKLTRRQLNIRNSHTILMMLAIGFPAKENAVCSSPRLPVSNVLTELLISEHRACE
jgi:nitroreductase